MGRLAAALLIALAGPLVLAEESGVAGSARVTYTTGASVYVDAGEDDGIEPGRILEVVRDGAVVARLRVKEVSSHRAVCAREEGGEGLVSGDVVRLASPAGSSRTEPEPAAPAEAARAEAPIPRPAGFHGRVGVRYLHVKERGGAGSGFSQPAIDLFLDGRRIGGGPFDIAVDVRSRRTYRPGAAAGDRSLTRVYRLESAIQQAGSPWRVTAGRQISPALAAVNIFDGVRGEYLAPRWGAGLFSGTQPAEGDLGSSSAIREHGAYVEFRSRPLADRRWALTGGAVGSYEDGEVNREFGFLQALYWDSRWSIWAGQEVDLNRDWKRDVEDGGANLTSSYLNVRYRIGQAWTFHAGYDSRRTVRLYRDRVTPETEFDDEYRTGGWAGASWRFLPRFSAGFDVRTSGGGSLGSADGYSVYFGADRLTALDLDFRTRSTRYTNERVDGWLHSANAGVNLGGRLHAGLSGGIRDETSPADPSLDRSLTWYGLDLDYSIGRHWLLWGSYERSQGSSDAADQIYTSVSYRW